MAIFPSFSEFKTEFQGGQNQVVYAPLAADLDTPVSLMHKLTGAANYSFILESVTGGEIRGRYSIIGMDPDVVWKCHDGIARISCDQESSFKRWIDEADAPFTSLRHLIKRSRIDLPTDLPASSAGLFGYLGYDMVRLVEDLPQINPDPLNLPDAILFRPTIIAVLDGVKSEVIVVSPAWADSGLNAQDAFDQARERVLNAVQKIESRQEPQKRNLG
ncbi:MAG: anthranilate synthase component I, partial [Rhodobacteraceae bacterium]|nr:anthranilate synthase component I [Paracoccaceae bacterium]